MAALQDMKAGDAAASVLRQLDRMREKRKSQDASEEVRQRSQLVDL